MENYFENCFNVTQVKTQFRKLLFQFHSDINKNSNDDKTKELISQYKIKLKKLHNTQDKNNNKNYTYVYEDKTENGIIEKLNLLRGLSMKDVEILLIGSFIWINGNTKEHKENLKNIGFRWQRIKQSWYFTPLKYKKIYSYTKLEDIKNKYGFQYIANKSNLIDKQI
jgi:hypothetical protein